MAIIHAIYENGVFKPKGPVSLPDGAEVVFEFRVVSEPGVAPDFLVQEFAWTEEPRNRADAETCGAPKKSS